MPLFLTPDSKVALLEQSMKVELRRDPPVDSTCFPKVLFVNKGFIGLARNRSVYRFSMSPKSEPMLAKFQFKGKETGETQSFELSLDQAYKWIKFLDPPFFDVHVCSQDSPYFCLMGCVNGKISLNMPRNDAFTGVINHFWFQINELTCTAKCLKSSAVAALPSKTFDRLGIECVGSTDDLKRALKQKTTWLTIVIQSLNKFVKGTRAQNEEAFVNDIVEKCKVISWMEEAPIFGIVSTIIKTCPNLKHLKIYCDFDKEVATTIESAVARLVRINLFIERMIKKLKGSSAECVVTVDLFMLDGAEYNKYPCDCVEMFRHYTHHFESVQEKTEHLPNGRFDTEFTIKHRDQNVSVDYNIDICYKHLEDDVDEMYEDNTFDDEGNTSDGDTSNGDTSNGEDSDASD